MILINMEMPRNCGECHQGIPCPLRNGTIGISQYLTKRHEDCPLVEVPTHGRLIDADELKELFMETITGIARRTNMKGVFEHMIRASAMVAQMIDDAPTVIEASGSQKNE